MKKNVLNRAVSLYPRQGAIAFLPFFCTVLLGKWGYPTPENAILHPILHPKASVNTGRFGNGCRKCRIFSKTFFEGKNRRCFGRSKTSDFFGQKYGCFASKVRMFASKKSDVFVFRNVVSLSCWVWTDAQSRVSLFVDGATIRAFAKRMQRSTTCPAYIGGSVVTEMAVQCKSPVNHQKRITDVVLHADTEEKIERHADTA